MNEKPPIQIRKIPKIKITPHTTTIEKKDDPIPYMLPTNNVTPIKKPKTQIEKENEVNETTYITDQPNDPNEPEITDDPETPYDPENPETPAPDPDDPSGATVVKSSLRKFADGKPVQKWRKLFQVGTVYWRWLVSQVSINGRSVVLARSRFIEAFGLMGLTPESLFQRLKGVIYTSEVFQEHVEIARKRLKTDLTTQAPYVMANQRLMVLNEFAERAIATSDPAKVYRAFEEIRREISLAQDKAKRSIPGAFGINLNVTGEGASVQVSLGDVMGVDANSGMNPALLKKGNEISDAIAMARKSVALLKDKNSAEDTKTITVEAEDIPPDDILV
jgi:hypothetical protein